MKLKAVAFDLGGTLVRYYEREQFPSILSEALANVHELISDQATVSLAEARDTALASNKERPDGKVWPVHERLARIFGLPGPLPTGLRNEVERAFLKPIFSFGWKYEDVDSTLSDLRDRGYRLAIVSNTPWGTPAEPWREELERFGLSQSVDVSCFCMDVGWRKPALPIFKAALDALAVEAGEAAFVGDNPRWDCEGPQDAGMVPILIDRERQHTEHVGNRICGLDELPGLLQRLQENGGPASSRSRTR